MIIYLNHKIDFLKLITLPIDMSCLTSFIVYCYYDNTDHTKFYTFNLCDRYCQLSKESLAEEIKNAKVSIIKGYPCFYDEIEKCIISNNILPNYITLYCPDHYGGLKYYTFSDKGILIEKCVSKLNEKFIHNDIYNFDLYWSSDDNNSRPYTSLGILIYDWIYIRLISQHYYYNNPTSIRITLSKAVRIVIKGDNIICEKIKVKKQSRKHQLLKISLYQRYQLIYRLLKVFNYDNSYKIYISIRNVETMFRSKIEQNSLCDFNVLNLINQYARF